MSEPEPEQPRAVQRFFQRAVTTYVVFALVGSLLSLCGAWLATGFDAGLHVFLAPAPLLAIYAFASKRWRLAAICAVLSLYFGWCTSGWLLPSPERVEGPTDESLVVLTWNLGLETCDPLAVAREILSLEPDIAFFQEANADKAEVLFEALAEAYPHRQHFPHDLFSKAFVSRIEPLSAELVSPPDTKNFLELSLMFDGALLSFTSMHTNKGFALRGRNWFGYERMLEQIRLAASRPTNIVLGDFNLTERNAVYRDIRDTGLVDSYRELHSGPGFTFPTFGRYHGLPLPPLLRIDYIWRTRDLRCLSIERTAPAESDHCGLVARFSRR